MKLIWFSWIGAVWGAPPAALEEAQWEVLSTKPVGVAWVELQEIPWCRAVYTIAKPIGELEGLVQDFEHYPQIFLRLNEVRVLEENVVYVKLDMPFPVANRDYVARFVREVVGEEIRFSWSAVEHKEAPLVDAIRLGRAAGQWRLKPLDSNNTEVTYTWNGELLGDFPDWALTRAWETQGTEVMHWLEGGIKR
ncbi:MAG: SRPBCC family protein [Myxococcota bacterium]|nr:SRPBCC family protein [Myxococcota bacterium]